VGRLQDQVAVVTGGANGIGRACAVRFAEEGADVVIGDLLPEPAQETVRAVEAAGRRAVFHRLDASSKEQNEALADVAVAEFGRIDVLLTAAGISHGDYLSGDLERDQKRVAQQLDYQEQTALAFCDIDVEDWRRVLEVNLTGTFLAIQAAARRMVEAGTRGRIITIASIAAKNPDAGPPAYTASKAGVWMLTKKAARDLAPAGIRVNSIGPGYTATHMTAVIGQLEERHQQLLAAIPMGRFGEAREIADAALFLAGDESSYMTGQILHPDGGFFTG
jgi:NAD(P)-dependent dehydrogenase (short-subunit alcohol dehydrogenase family)